MVEIANVRSVLARSLWASRANAAAERPPLRELVKADVAVIGVHYTLLSAALHLAEVGRTVVLLEAEQQGLGASGRNGGQVNPGLKAGPDEIETCFDPDLGPRIVVMTGGNGDLVFDLIARHGIACDVARVGWIRAATTPRVMLALNDVGGQCRARAAAVESLEATEMTKLLGTRAYAGGLIDRRGGILHPLNYALGLVAAAERLGPRLHGNSWVAGVKASDDSVTVTVAEGLVTAATALSAQIPTPGCSRNRSGPRSFRLPLCRSRQVRWAPSWSTRSCQQGIRPRTREGFCSISERMRRAASSWAGAVQWAMPRSVRGRRRCGWRQSGFTHNYRALNGSLHGVPMWP